MAVSAERESPRLPSRRADRLEIIAVRAAPDVELIADDRKPHRVRAVQQLAVFDGVKTDVRGDVAGAPPVPAGAMACFRRLALRGVHFACWGT